MKPARAATFYQMLTARGERDPEPQPSEFLKWCAVCKCSTVWRAVWVGRERVRFCLKCQEER